MNDVSESRAKALAERKIKELADAADGVFLIIEEAARDCAQGWVFFYNSRKFLETRDIIYALAGNGPIYVSRLGEVYVLPSSLPWEDAVKEMEDSK